MNNLGNVPAGTIIYLPFGSYNSNGASVALSGLAVTDIEIYKDGGTTQRASDAGYSVAADFDGVTGINLVSINLGDNTDSGFFAVGSSYFVVVSSVTIDSQTVNMVLGTFRIVEAEAVAGRPQAQTAGLTSGALAAINAEVLDVINVDSFAEPTGVPAASNTLAAKVGVMYMALRNGLETTTSEKRFKDSAGNTEFKKTLSDDGTTYTESAVTAP